MKLPKDARIFTLDEANQLVPRLAHIIERMKTAFFQLTSLREQRGQQDTELEAFLYENRDDTEIRERLIEMDTLLREIESTGCYFKGLELGLVDFPAYIEDEPVLLCWQYGEPEISFFHRLDEGFQGRMPLPKARGSRSVN